MRSRVRDGSPTTSPTTSGTDDRSTRARIRDVALTCFAQEGIARTSVRAVAAAADVAPSHVIHYFGSKEGLRAACDELVATKLREQQEEVVGAGLDLDPLASLRRSRQGLPILEYLARSLVEESPSSDALVDQLVADSERYIAALVANGLVTESADPRTRAVLLTFWSLGQLALHTQLERLLGVRMTVPDENPGQLTAYAAATLELLGPGLLTPAMAERLQQMFTSEENQT